MRQGSKELLAWLTQLARQGLRPDGGCRSLASSFFRNPKRIESYFSAIGGESDAPPPDLTPEQVNAILRTNEHLILNNRIAPENEEFLQNFLDILQLKKRVKNRRFQSLRQQQQQQKPNGMDREKLYSLIDNPWVSQVESNQLASNHPVEDRIRVATVDLGRPEPGLMLAVFDGHGGGFCADIIVRRLFHYVAIALKASRGGQPDFGPEFGCDKVKTPSRVYHHIYAMYEDEVARGLQARIEEFERRALQRFAQNEQNKTAREGDSAAMSALLRRAFLQCDQDLSEEIEENLVNTNSNVLLHYYHSLAVSGCCVTLVLVDDDQLYVASTGDCRAVMGLLQARHVPPPESDNPQQQQPLTRKQLRMVELSQEHNADNVNELNRIYAQHPKEEQNWIIREHRLLGQLMPLRAFGDFSFKWTVDQMKALGLTRAFGSHIIPSHYRTPPYLTAEPEITTMDLTPAAEPDVELDRFVVVATDGLWEQFDSPRKVIKAVNRYRQNWFKQIAVYTSAKRFNIEPSAQLTLGEISRRLRQQITEPPATTFERVTADDDLIEDINCGTFLLRTALSDISAAQPGGGAQSDKFSHHVDQYEQQRQRHAKLVSYLTLPPSVVRNFRDDISLVVIGLKHVTAQ